MPAKQRPSRSAPPEKGTLDAEEQTQATEHASIRALVIHEVLRAEGEEELKRRLSALVWSGLAAGMSMGFSFLSLALIQSALPAAPWTRLIDSFGYTIGFLVVILGRQALFTESTLTAVLPVLVRRDRHTFYLTLRFWLAVLTSNLLGSLIFAAVLSTPGIFSDDVVSSLTATAHDAISGSFFPTLVKAILAGWMIALMVWLLPSAKTAKIFVILILTYIVGIGRFSHIVAGSIDAAYAVFTGHAKPMAYLTGFFLPTLIGNTIGGVGMVALLNHAPLAPDLENTTEASIELDEE